METVFIVTHIIMLSCIITIVSIIILSPDSNEQQEKRIVTPELVLKVKSMQVKTISIYRAAAAGLFTLFIK